MVEVDEKAFLEIERAFSRYRIKYYTFAVVEKTGVAVRYPKFQARRALGFATAMFNQMTKGLDKDEKAVVQCKMTDSTWYYVIPTRTPQELEDSINATYTKGNGFSVDDNATGGDTSPI
jgi:hypothetical protein